MRKKAGKDIDIAAIYQDPKYTGKYVIVMGEKIYSSEAKHHSFLLEKLVKKYPHEKPLTIYIPKDDTLILLF